MATTTKRGRKPKGQREQISAKVPSSHKPLLERAAAEHGMPLCDYVAVVLAEHHGLEIPSYLIPSDKEHPKLPISA